MAGSSVWLPVQEPIDLAEFPDQGGHQVLDPGLFLLGRTGVSAPVSRACQPSYPGSVLPLLSSGYGSGPEVHGTL